MTQRSTTWFIHYDLRPSKQVERRIVIDCLDAAARAGIDPSRLPLIGMGGFHFVDFILAQKLLGQTEFVSIERDADLIERCNFNKPFESIEVFSGEVSDFFNERGIEKPSVVWLDYEEGLSESIMEEMFLLTSVVPLNSFAFVTLNGELPKRYAGEKTLKKRRSMLLEEFSGFAEDIEDESMQPKSFPYAACLLLARFLNYGFAKRHEGNFAPLVRIVYKDSNWMVTVGGFFGNDELGTKVSSSVRAKCSFLDNSEEKAYVVQQFNITDAERRVFDLHATSRPRIKKFENKLRQLGFHRNQIEQYAELMRFIPRYFESLR